MKIIFNIIFSLFPIFIFSQDFSTYEWEFYNTDNSGLKNNHIREILFDDKTGLTWVTTNEQGLYSFDGKNWKQYPMPEKWEKSWWLNNIYRGENGKFWIAGYFGYIITFDTKIKKWERIKFPEGQPWIIRANKKGVKLIATAIQTGKLYQYNQGRFTLVEDRFKDAFDIKFKKNGNALVSFRYGVYEYPMKPDGTYSLHSGERIFKHAIYDMAFDSQDNLWAASFSSKYLHKMENNHWNTIIDAPKKIHYDLNGKSQYIIHNVMILPDDRALITTQYNASIAIYDGKNWEAYNLPIKIKDDGIERIRMAKDSSLWCATWKNGIYVFRPKKEIVEIEPLPVWIAPVSDGETINFIPDKNRIAKTLVTLEIPSEKIRLKIRDYKKVDGDIASIYFNGKVILNKKSLKKEPDIFELELEPGDNEILLYAHNLGTMPPNTASLKIFYGNEEKEIIIDSDFENCGRVIIRKE